MDFLSSIKWNSHFLSDHTVIPVIIIIGVIILIWDTFFLKSENRQKIGVVILGMAMLGWLDLGSLILLCVLSFIVLAIVRFKLPIKRFLYPMLFIALGILVAIKDQTFILKNTSPWIPIGVSYYFFRLISFLIEYANNKSGYRNFTLLDYYTWIFFFPTFLAGPILRFHEFKIIKAEKSGQQKLKYFSWFWGALILKLLLVDYIIYPLTYTIMLPAVQTGSLIGAPIPLMIFGFMAFLHAYFDLMLYTEMSKSLAGYLGFTNVDNFKRPLLATNISQFWQRWHISLSGWTRDYVFFPTLAKTRKIWLASYASMLTIGIWHSISLNWIVWALFHGTALNIYSWWRGTSIYTFVASKPCGRVFLCVTGNGLTLVFVGTIFIFVAFHDIKTPLNLFKTCFGLG